MWQLEESILYYKKQGAPADQSVLISLLREVQQEYGDSIPLPVLKQIAQAYGIKDTLLQAIIKRIPSLRLANNHILELCAGPNCGKHQELAACAEKLHAASGRKFVLKFVPCMRMCGKGPNIKWDGTLCHKADKKLLEMLLNDNGIDFESQP